MNIIEEDVRSELESYGLVDSRISIGKESVTVQGKKHWYQFFASHVLYKLTSGIGVPSMVIEKYIESSETLPKEHRPMCRSIVRLITGDYETGLDDKPEKTLEEYVNEKIGSFSDGTHAEFISEFKVVVSRFGGNVKYHIFHDHIERYDKQPGEVRHDTYTIDAYKRRDSSKLGKAYIDIASKLSPGSTPEKSLEEKVREILGREHSKRVTIPELVSCSEVCVVLSYCTGSTETVYPDATIEHNSDGRKEIEKYSVYDEYKTVLFDIAAELKRQQPTPTYTELEQRVRELETEVIQQNRESDTFREQSDVFDKENIELTSKVKSLQDRITELEAQLQDYVSPADHKREMRNNEELLAIITKQRDDCNAQAKQYLSWFHREYAKNAGVK